MWIPDEVALAGAEHLDTVYVAGYDRKSGFDPAADIETLRALGLDRTKTLVDIGAGTGTFAIAAAPFARRVVAVDVSPVMVGVARARVAELQIGNVEVVPAGWLSYQHAGDPAEFVYSRNALHHLPDFWKAVALRRVAGMIAPGGFFFLRDLVFSFPLPQAEVAIEAWLAAAPERAEDGWTRAELETHLRTEFSTFHWLLEPMIKQAGFEIREAQFSRNQAFATYLCRRAM